MKDSRSTLMLSLALLAGALLSVALSSPKAATVLCVVFSGIVMIWRERNARSRRFALQAKAESDSLTGVYNHEASRSSIDAFLQGEGKTGRHALFMVDIDDFKQINDLYGHFEGDRVLRAMAASIRRLFRATDIVGRIGGDEFIVFLKDVPSLALVNSKARELCEMLYNAHPGPEHRRPLSCSVGIALYADSGCDFDTLYRQADAALYQAKERGKHQFVFFVNEAASQRFPSAAENAERALEPAGVNLSLAVLLEFVSGGVLLLEVGELVRVLYRSRAYRALVSVDPERFPTSGGDPFQFVDPRDVPALETLLRQAADDGQLYTLSYGVRGAAGFPDGGRRCLRALRIAYPSSTQPVLLAVVEEAPAFLKKS